MNNSKKSEILQKIKQNGKKKKINIFGKFYRMLCWIGLKIQFTTYNKRRRVRKFFAPVGGRISDFVNIHVAQPVTGAWNEFCCICGELKNRAGLGATFRQHGAFFAGVLNTVLPVICIGVLAVVAATVMTSSHALEVTCNGKVLGYIQDESVYNDAVQLLSQRTVNTSADYIDSLTPSYSMASVNSSMNMRDQIRIP